MLRAICGQKGNGKTISTIRFMALRKQPIYVNFPVNIPNATRMKEEDFLIYQEIEDHTKVPKKGVRPTKIVARLNSAFWEKKQQQGNFDIYGDEWHKVMNSRRAMSRWNIIMSDWMSQVRKVLGDDEKNDFFLVTQRLDRIDSATRELLDEIIYCQKYFMTPRGFEEFKKTKTINMAHLIPGNNQTQQWAQTILTKCCQMQPDDSFKIVTKQVPVTLILQYRFLGEQCVENYVHYYHDRRMKTYDAKDIFFANPFMKYYDKNRLVKFGENNLV